MEPLPPPPTPGMNIHTWQKTDTEVARPVCHYTVLFPFLEVTIKLLLHYTRTAVPILLYVHCTLHTNAYAHLQYKSDMVLCDVKYSKKCLCVGYYQYAELWYITYVHTQCTSTTECEYGTLSTLYLLWNWDRETSALNVGLRKTDNLRYSLKWNVNIAGHQRWT